MSVVKSLKQAVSRLPAGSALHGIVGQIVTITDEGIALVEFPGCAGPVAARSMLSDHQRVAQGPLPVQVFLVFENGDPESPIISGVLNESPFIPSFSEDEQEVQDFTVDKQGQVEVDGRRMTFNAKEEILLRCGKSSILLRRDGKVVIKGTNLVSRSSAANKIKGSSVSIN